MQTEDTTPTPPATPAPDAPPPAPEWGPTLVPDVGRDLYAMAKGVSRETLKHLRAAASIVLGELYQEGTIAQNPARDVTVPKAARKDRRERAVLTDEELAVYLAAPLRVMARYERYEIAALQRQVMSILSRTLGGSRTGDLHAMDWADVDTAEFYFVHVARAKTERPERLAIPAVLRPYLARWHAHWGNPTEGPVFPVLRGDNLGAAKSSNNSYAKALRRDLQRAFKWAREQGDKEIPAEDSQRWRELFSLNEPHTKPVDFHSWRRAYVQSLADAGVSAQDAAALAGHSTLEAHMRYLSNTTRLRSVPDSALPKIGLLPSPSGFRPNAVDDLPRVGTPPESNPLVEACVLSGGSTGGADGTRTRGLRRDRAGDSENTNEVASAADGVTGLNVAKGPNNVHSEPKRKRYERPALLESTTLPQDTCEAIYLGMGGAL